MRWPVAPRRLPLETRGRGSQPAPPLRALAPPLRRRAERADHFVLEAFDADVEPEELHVGTGQVDAEAGSFECTLVVTLLAYVAKPRQRTIASCRAESLQRSSEVLGAADRDD